MVTRSETRTQELEAVAVCRYKARSFLHPWILLVVGLGVESSSQQRKRLASCGVMGRCPLSLLHNQERTIIWAE